MDSRIIWKNFKHSQIPSSVGLNKEFYKKIKPGSKVLDFGCAWGRIPLELQKRGYNVVGFDINETEILKAKKLAEKSNSNYETQVKFDVADALKLPYENNSFDVCLVQAFMTILIDPKHRENILDETKRVLKNNGILYMSVFGLTQENPKYNAF